MKMIVMSTDIQPKPDSKSDWLDAICKMIHNVQVDNLSSRNFAARISGRRYGEVSCASFWSKPHDVSCSREQLSNAGAGGYLLSWQMSGEAHIEQGKARIRLAPGGIAIVDGRQPMHVAFPTEVRRIVARLPARALEERLPGFLRLPTMAFTPTGPLAEILFSYLMQLSGEDSALEPKDMELIAENICNLLKIAAGHAGLDCIDSKSLKQQLITRYMRQKACDPGLTLDAVAGHVNMSRRTVQKILQEMNSSFTEFITEERLVSAAKKLSLSAEVPISDVAYNSGFSDISHFNHLFKRRFSMTPSDYRNSQPLQ